MRPPILRPGAARARARVLLLAGALGVCTGPPPAARADTLLYDDGRLALTGRLDLGAAALATLDTDFGAGLTEPDGEIDRDVDWFEGFARPRLAARYAGGPGTFYAGVSVVAAMTRGVGDPSGGTFGRPEAAALEHLYAGWSSGGLWPQLGPDAVDLSVGAQDFEIGDGFLVSDGQMDEGGSAALWLGPRNAFRHSAIARINTRPVRADLFYLETRADSGDAKPIGLNVEYVDEARGVLGATYFHILEAPVPGFATRDGLHVASLRGQGTPFAGTAVEDLFLSFEVAHEHNGHAGREADALAWYAEAGYTFERAPWSPYLTYRFSRFSGDDPATRESESFDPLFVGAPRGWGTWFQGEITGQYLVTNSNLDVHMAQLDLAPSGAVTLHAFFFDFTLDEPAAAGARDSAFAREVNLMADVALTERLEVSAVYAVAFPGAGARQAVGGDAPYHLFALAAFLSF